MVDHPPDLDSGGHLLSNLLLFGRLLRRAGLPVTSPRLATAVQALRLIDIGRRDDFYHTLRCLLVHRRQDLPLFDAAFAAFWRPPTAQPGQSRPRLVAQEILVQPHPAADPGRGPVGPAEVEGGTADFAPGAAAYSARELLRHKDFAQLTPDEEAVIRRLISRLSWQIGRRRTRRQQPGRGPNLDLRRSLRAGMRTGGEILVWRRRRRRWQPRPLVILADVSGSMERYSRLLIQFLYSLAGGRGGRVELFVFSTRLTRITRQLRQREVDRALRDVARAVPDWSGGTRIGEALRRFNHDWSRRLLAGGAVVLLISDGWDRGDPALLGQQMARLGRRCHRLIWLNPLLGVPGYAPLTRGMQAALPHVDDFLPVHNLASLEELAEHLFTLGETAGPRRTAVRPNAWR